MSSEILAYGHRVGHHVCIGHSIEDVKPKEMPRRYTAMMQT
jgi:hypothetical protein